MALTLGALLARPGIVLASDEDPFAFRLANRPLPPTHPLAVATQRARSADRALWRSPFTDTIDFVNLGRDSAPAPGLAASLRERPGSRPRVTWFVWGLSRPSVNLFLAPALLRHSQPPALPPEGEALARLLELAELRDCAIPATVRVGHLIEPLTYRVYPDTPIAEIQHLMVRRDLRALPVVGERHEMLGLIMADRLLARILPGREKGHRGRQRDLLARDLMTRSVMCLSENEELAAASRHLASRGISRLPVFADGRLTGFLTGEAVIRAFSETFVASRAPVRLELG